MKNKKKFIKKLKELIRQDKKEKVAVVENQSGRVYGTMTGQMEKDDGRGEAVAQLESITEMVSALLKWQNTEAQSTEEDRTALEEAEQTIQEDALSVGVRSDWYQPGQLPDHRAPSEFTILLCTGGPAVRIIGTLNQSEPQSARLVYQDWGTPWTEYRLTAEQEETVLTYARCFYYGE